MLQTGKSDNEKSYIMPLRDTLIKNNFCVFFYLWNKPAMVARGLCPPPTKLPAEGQRYA